MGKKKKKFKLYELNETEIVCGLVGRFCKFCGCQSLLVRKVLFKKGTEHLENICAFCKRHNFYVSQAEFKWILDKSIVSGVAHKHKKLI